MRLEAAFYGQLRSTKICYNKTIMKFVIFHGAFGSPQSNWFPELAEKLRELGQEVIIPKFPTDDWDDITKPGPKVSPKKQNLGNWLTTFEKEVLPKIQKRDKLCFVAHSLWPVFVLHVVEKYNLKLDCGLFASPFMENLGRAGQIDHVNKTFYKTNFDFKKLQKLIPLSYVLYSDNDPYVDKKFSLDFAKKLGSCVIQVEGGGHLNSEIGLVKFPLFLELCKTRIDFPSYVGS